MVELLNELSRKGRQGYTVPEIDVPVQENVLPDKFLRKMPVPLPEVSEVDLNRHFTQLSRLNYALSTHFYPLGSCTMKYNPPVNEKISRLPGLTALHPYQPEETVQGAMEILYNLERSLCAIAGMDRFTLQPAAGAHGEFTGLLIIRAYFAAKGEKRTKIIVPDSAHGTNPASAALAGFEIVSLKSGANGQLDPEKLKDVLTPDVAAIMMTVPNTLGVFEKEILAISKLMHKNGSLMYYDGANLNALLGVARPGDLGFDVCHVNLHKTFATPHGGGGPGAGPVGVKKFLEPFLPLPLVKKVRNKYHFDYDRPQSIGRVRSFYGNFAVLVKAYAYIVALGAEGLRKVGVQAVLNANYLLALLKDKLPAPAGDRCMHEFVLSGKPMAAHGVHTLDIAKRILDCNCYAPTIYFPMIVEEAIMVEPTETESKESLDRFAAFLEKIIEEAKTSPETVKRSPVTTPVSRLNEVEAARKPILHW
jgi:glycine dehydrogenase subunit 2